MKIRLNTITTLGVALGFGLLLNAPSAFSQTGQDPAPDPQVEAQASTLPAPRAEAFRLSSVRDIELGMTVDQVKAKLGKPDVADDAGMYFTLSGGDSVQIGLDADKKVRTVAAIYAAGSKSAPTIQDVLGTDEAAADGDIYKMERYPDAGYWVSYSRSGSDKKPLVVVTMRKIF
jgi:hypothetical protein